MSDVLTADEQTQLQDIGLKALNAPLKRERVGEPADSLDAAKVSAYAQRGFTNDTQARSFVRYIYQQYFNQSPDSDFDSLTRFVHGTSTDPKTAVSFIAKTFKPLAAVNDAFDLYDKNPDPVAKAKEAFEWANKERIKSDAASVDVTGGPGFGSAAQLSFEQATPEQRKEDQKNYEQQLRGASPKYRILDAESQLTPNQKTAIRLAVAHGPEAVQDTLAGFDVEGQAHARALLAATAEATKPGSLWHDTWHAIATDWAGAKDATSRFLSRVIDSPIEGAGPYNTIRNQFSDGTYNGKSIFDGKGNLTPEARPAVESAFKQALFAHDPLSTGAEQLPALLDNFSAVYQGSKTAAEDQKRLYLTAKAQQPPREKTGSFVRDYGIPFVAALPNLAAGLSTAAIVGPAGPPVYFSSQWFGEKRDELIYDQGFTPRQADNVAAPFALLYGMAMAIKLDAVLPGPVKQDVMATIGKTYFESLGQVLKGLGHESLQTAATVFTASEMQTVTEEAMKRTANYVGAKYPEIPFDKLVADSLLPNAINTAGFVLLHAGARIGQHAVQNYVDRVPVEKGAPAKFAELSAERDQAVAGEAAPAAEQMKVTPERQAAVDEEVKKVQQDLEEQRVAEQGAPKETKIASERPVEKPQTVPGVARFDGVQERPGGKPPMKLYSWRDPVTGEETSGAEADVPAGMKLGDANNKVADEPGAKSEPAASKANPLKEKLRSDAAVEIAYRMLNGEQIDLERAKELVKQYFKGAGRAEDILLTATRLRDQLANKSLAPHELVRALHNEEIDMRYKDRFADEMTRIQRKYYLEGAYDARLESRKEAENLRREIVGLNELPDEEKIPKMEKILRDTWRSGKAAGIDVGKPAETVMVQALDAKEERLKLSTRTLRQDSYENDLGAVMRVQSGGTEEKARDVLTQLFGAEEAKRISRAAKGDTKATFAALQDLLENRLASLYKSKIIDEFSKLKGGKVGLTENAKAALDALQEKFGFPLDQLQKLNDLRAKIDNVYKPMARDGRISPEQLQAKEDAYDGYKQGLAKFFQDMPFSKLDELFSGTKDSPGIAKILRDSINEKYTIRQDRLIERSQQAGEMHQEVVRGGKEKRVARGSGSPGILGKVRDWNTSVDTRTLLFAGGKQSSTIDRVLHAEPFDSTSRMKRTRGRIERALDDERERLGISEVTYNHWGFDAKKYKLGTGELSLTTREKMSLYLAMKDPDTQVQYGNTRALKTENLRGLLGGVKFGDAENAERQIKAVTDTLTDQQKAFADSRQRLAMQDPELQAALNAESMRREGEKAFTKEFYYPLARDIKTSPIRAQMQSIDDLRQWGRQSVDNLGFTKRRVANKNDIVVRDIDAVVREHIYDATRYAYLTDSFATAMDALADPTLRTALVKRFGDKAVEQTLETYRREAGLAQRDPTAYMKVMRYMQQNIARGLLWSKIKSIVGARVLGGISMEGVLMGEHGPEVAARFLAHTGLPFKAFWLDSKNVAARDYLLGDGYNDDRFQRNQFSVFSQTFNAGLEGQTDAHWYEKWNKVAEAWGVAKIYGRKVSDFGMNPYATADLKTAVATYRALVDSGFSPEEARNLQIAYIRRTQPPSSAFDETQAYRTLSHPGFWMLYPFLGAPSRAANLIQRSLIELNGAQTTTPKAVAFRKVVSNGAATLAVVATSTLMGRAVHQLSNQRAATENEDDKLRRDTGYAIGEALDSLVAPGLGGVWKGLFSLATTGKVDTMSLVQKQAEDVGKGFSVLLRAYQNDAYDPSDERQQAALLKLGVAAGTLSGIPLAGPAADAKLLQGLVDKE